MTVWMLNPLINIPQTQQGLSPAHVDKYVNMRTLTNNLCHARSVSYSWMLISPYRVHATVSSHQHQSKGANSHHNRKKQVRL